MVTVERSGAAVGRCSGPRPRERRRGPIGTWGRLAAPRRRPNALPESQRTWNSSTPRCTLARSDTWRPARNLHPRPTRKSRHIVRATRVVMDDGPSPPHRSSSGASDSVHARGSPGGDGHPVPAPCADGAQLWARLRSRPAAAANGVAPPPHNRRLVAVRTHAVGRDYGTRRIGNGPIIVASRRSGPSVGTSSRHRHIRGIGRTRVRPDAVIANLYAPGARLGLPQTPRSHPTDVIDRAASPCECGPSARGEECRIPQLAP